MNRRNFIAAAAAAVASTRTLPAAPRIDKSRISAITDEIAKTPEAAIEFAKKYGLQWLELRNKPGSSEYFRLPPDELRLAARQFADAGIRVSFLNTSLLKYGMPGVEYSNARTRPSPRYERRDEELKQALEAAHLLGTDKVRVFTFLRAADPAAQFAHVADIIAGHAELAAKEKILLLVENEATCNVATSAETAAFVKLIPSPAVGINWDPLNAASRDEIPFPAGYELLPASRIRNVQIKGMNVLRQYKEWMDWTAVFRRLEKDGYQDQIGLETHIFGEIQVQKSHEAMEEILRLVQS